jgi:cobalt-precorrin-5B (C1)-methyltransferase
MRGHDGGALRRGWTTGACATAGARAAFAALLTGRFRDPVLLLLPRARAGVIKDAGDDPDVTHGALIVAKVAREPLARLVAAGAREVAFATLSGKTAIELAIVDWDGGFLTRVGGWRRNAS